MFFADRCEAGKLLAKKLKPLLKKADKPVVYALVRGGVVVAYEVARGLNAPLDVVLVRKIGYPGYSEYAIGAIAENDAPILNTQETVNIDERYLSETVRQEREVIASRRDLYLGDFERIHAKDKTAIIVDDGIATGLTMKAAVQLLARQNPKRIIVAVPISSEEALQEIGPLVDEIVTLEPPEDFRGSIGAHYIKFEQVEDAEVISLLNEIQSKT